VLRSLTLKHPAAHGDFVECYERINGAAVCVLWESINTREIAALTLLSIEDWEVATEPWSSGELAGFMQGCAMFTRGTWRVIAELPSESQCLVYFFDGEHEGRALAGSMFCLGLDGILGFEEVLAPSFAEFIGELTRDPAALLDRIGFCWHIMRDARVGWGDPVEAYVPDVRGHPDLTEWKK
jgi:hypothetical protein